MQIIKTFWRTIGWAIFVLLLSAWSGEQINKIPLLHIHNLDKVIHFGMYFIFSFLMMHDFSNSKKKTFALKQVIIFSVAVAIFYGGIMELLQSIPRLHRTTDIFDFIANATGSLTAVILYKPITLFLNWVTAVAIKPPRHYSL
jgi:VanZ family protein